RVTGSINVITPDELGANCHGRLQRERLHFVIDNDRNRPTAPLYICYPMVGMTAHRRNDAALHHENTKIVITTPPFNTDEALEIIDPARRFLYFRKIFRSVDEL